MKAFFFGSNFEQWCSLASLLGFESYMVGGASTENLYPCVNYTLNIEDDASNVVFIPEHIPISKMKSIVKKARIVIVWREYKTGTIENVEHDLNISTKTYIEKKILNSIYVPEYIDDIFEFYKVVPKVPQKTTSDSDLENKSTFQIAQILKDTKTYTGTRYIQEATACGCDTVYKSNEPPTTKSYVATKLFEVLNKFLLIPNSN